MTALRYSTLLDSASEDEFNSGGVPGRGGGRQVEPLQECPGLQAHVDPLAPSTWPPWHAGGAEATPDPLTGQDVAIRSPCHMVRELDALVEAGVMGQSLACARMKSHFAPMSGEHVSHDPEKLVGRPSASAPS